MRTAWLLAGLTVVSLALAAIALGLSGLFQLPDGLDWSATAGDAPIVPPGVRLLLGLSFFCLFLSAAGVLARQLALGGFQRGTPIRRPGSGDRPASAGRWRPAARVGRKIGAAAARAGADRRANPSRRVAEEAGTYAAAQQPRLESAPSPVDPVRTSAPDPTRLLQIAALKTALRRMPAMNEKKRSAAAMGPVNSPADDAGSDAAGLSPPRRISLGARPEEERPHGDIDRLSAMPSPIRGAGGRNTSEAMAELRRRIGESSADR